MKGLCYIVLILGFFLFFQQNPLYAIICIVLFLGVYILFKSRSSQSSRRLFGFLKGANSQQDNRIDDLITLMMIQQLLSGHNDHNQHNSENTNQDKNEYIDKVKNEVIDLLDEQ